MCASYGLGGGPLQDCEVYGLDPLDSHEGRAVIDRWIAEHSGRAAITGRRAVNLNPIIRAATAAATAEAGAAANTAASTKGAGNASSARTVDLAWWWLWQDGSGPVKFSAFNSRDDRLLRSWRRPFQQRALLPATWFVEKKVRFELPNSEAFGIAAITHSVTDEATGEERLTYSMVTRDAVGKAADTWHRMPLVLPRELHGEWLDPERAGDESLVAEVRHASEEISAEMTPAAPPTTPSTPTTPPEAPATDQYLF